MSRWNKTNKGQMLISTQFNSIAQADKEIVDGEIIDHRGPKKVSDVLRPAASNPNEVSKKKNKGTLTRKKEFPSLIIEEEMIQAKKIEMIKDKAGQMQKGKIDTTDRDLSLPEVLTFFSFTILLFACVFLQVDISSSYKTNFGINNWLNNQTFTNGVQYHMTADRISQPSDFWEWIDFVALRQLQKTQDADQREIPVYRRHRVPENNILISPIRLTQRMIQSVDNTDVHTKHLISKKWISTSTEFTRFDEFLEGVETDEPFTAPSGGQFLYQKEGSYGGHGGYVVNLDVLAQTEEQTRDQVARLKQDSFINNQTRLITTDMMFFNPYTQFYTILVLDCNFLPSGLIDASETMFYNIKAAYYTRGEGLSVIRALLECLYVAILCLYTAQESRALVKVILKKFELQRKLRESEDQRKQRKEAREREKKTRDARRSACNSNANEKQGNAGATEAGEADEDLEDQNVWNEGYGKEKDETTKMLEERAGCLKATTGTYLIGSVKSVLLGLLDHFQNIWNFFDVAIIVLACISVPFWMRIVVLHRRHLDRVDIEGKGDEAAQTEELKKILNGEASSVGGNWRQVVQNDDVQHIGHLLTLYRDMQGCLMLLVILKCLNYIEKFNKKVGMMFSVIQFAKNQIMNFSIVFFLMFECFVQMNIISFGGNFDRFKNHNSSFFAMWRYLHHELDIVGEVSEYDPLIANFVNILFVVATQFVFFNMLRAFISHAYFEVSKQQNTKLTLDEELALEHWVFKLKSYRGPKWYTDWREEQSKALKAKQDGQPRENEQNADGVKSVLNQYEALGDVQKDERQRLEHLKKTIKQRIESEDKVIAERQINAASKRGSKTQRAQMNSAKEALAKSTLSKGIQKAVQDVESDEGSFQEELDEAIPKVDFDDLKFFCRADFEAEGDKPREKAAGPPGSKEAKLGQSKESKANASSNLSGIQEIMNEELDDNADVVSENPENKEAQEQVERIQNIQKEEKNRTLLERGAWDKNFSDGGNSLIEDFQSDKNLALMSEFEQKEEEKSQLIKCGKILWGSLTFFAFLTLFIAVLINQMESRGKFHLNHEIDDAIEALRWKNRTYHADVDVEDTLVNSVTLRGMQGMSDARIFLQEVLPTLATRRSQTVNFEENNDPLEFTSTFIHDRKYFVGDIIKIGFKFKPWNELWALTKQQLLEKNEFLELRADDGFTELFIKKDAYDQVTADQQSKPLEDRWYYEAIGIPEYYVQSDLLDPNNTYCLPFTGKGSKWKYDCNEETKFYEIYVNISMTDEEAIKIRQDSIANGFDEGPWPFRKMSYNDSINQVVHDDFFDAGLKGLQIEFITYEHLYDLHAHTRISIEATPYGTVVGGVKTNSMRLNNFQTLKDYIYACLTLLYIVLYSQIFVTFIQNTRERDSEYRKWVKFNIDYLSDVERAHREKKKPDIIRYLEVMLDGYAIIDLIYTVLTIWSVVSYISIMIDSYNLQSTYPFWPDLDSDDLEAADIARQEQVQKFISHFIEVLNRFNNYKYVVAISTLFIALKFFGFFASSKNMKPLVNVLVSSKGDLLNFLIIFFCFLLGYLSMSYLSFGWFVQDFSTIEKSFVVVFEISLPTFYSYEFLDESAKLAPGMSAVFFLTLTIMFLFFFTNIFLAIMMHSYQENVGKFKRYSSGGGGKKSDEISWVKSFFYCLIQNDRQEEEKQEKPVNRVRKGEDKLVLGINQKLPIKPKPEYLQADFDPYDPYCKYNQKHYMDKMDNLDLNMQVSRIPIRLWTTQTADEVYEELTQRAEIRKVARDLKDIKYQFLQNGGYDQSDFDEFSYQQSRIEYWNYLRMATQFTAFQNKVITAIQYFKEKQVDEKCQKHEIQKIQTLKLYKKVEEIERPIEIQLKINLDLGQIEHCMNLERNILKQKVESREFLHLEEKERKKNNLDQENSFMGSQKTKRSFIGSELQKSTHSLFATQAEKSGLQGKEPALKMTKSTNFNTIKPKRLLSELKIEDDQLLDQEQINPMMIDDQHDVKVTTKQDLRKEFFNFTNQNVRDTLQPGFLTQVEERPSEVYPSVVQSPSNQNVLSGTGAPSGKLQIPLNDIEFEQNDVIHMGKYGEATGGDIDQIEQHLSESMNQIDSLDNTLNKLQPGQLKGISKLIEGPQGELNQVQSEEDLMTDSENMSQDY